ncbi:MAG: TMEM43 family protein [Alphaproteobacteria bacterium]
MADENQPNEPSSGTYTETTSQSWLQRMKGAITGVLVGIALVPASIWFLAWNEDRAVTTARSLTEGAAAVVSVEAAKVDPANNGKLIYVTGELATTGTLTDAEFGVSAEGVMLVRQVEMFQWREKSESKTREKIGGGTETVTTYSYERTWSTARIDSSSFKQPGGHQNPEMRYSGRNYVSPNVTLGAFSVPERLVTQVGNAKPVEVTRQMVEQFVLKSGQAANFSDSAIFIGSDPASPKVGDLRVSFKIVPKQTVSIVAQQSANSFAPYQTKAGNQLMMLSTGTVAANAMFKQAESANRTTTWLFRLGGCIAMFIGFSMIMGPIRMLGAVLPILSQLFQLGTGLVALVLTAIVAPITIAIAWFAVRPVTAAIVLAAGLVLAFGIVKLRKKKIVAPPQAATPAA